MSVSPAQKRSKPPPVPAVPTSMLTPGCSSPKAAAAAVVSGPTVLEPSMMMSPLSSAAASPVVLLGGGRLGFVALVVVPATPSGADCQGRERQQEED